CTRDNLNICRTGPFLIRFGQTKQPNSQDASSARCSRREHASEDRPAPSAWMATAGRVPPLARRKSARQARGPVRERLGEGVTFCQDWGYSDVIFWTESALTAAAHLYQSAGFRKTEEKPGRMWGVDLVEEKYELRLD